ncbi:MAG: phospholipid carrier-dependent glycosyltransferase [Vicinamibacterales bacterium]
MRPRWALAIVLAVGAVLRFWNIDAGMPYRIGVDEPVIAERAIGMMRTGDFNPRFYDYPGLYIYLQLVVGCVRFVTGAMSGLWRSVGEFHPEHLFLWTRMLNAALGTVTIALLYQAGKRWGPWVAVTAAAILAVWHNHVRESHFALTDAPLTFLTVATFLLSLRAYESGRLLQLVAAGACAGLASATKYSGAYALLLPLVAAGVTRAPVSVRLLNGAAVLAASCLAFLIAAPYTLLDLPGFLNAFGALSGYYRPRPFAEGASIYLGHIRVAIGWAGLIAIGAGIIWGTVRALRENDLRRWALIVLFPVVYFYAVSTKQLIFARYLLPAVPFFCLLMALVIVDATTLVWQRSRSKRTGAAILAVGLAVLLFPAARAGFEWPAQYGRRTTQDIAYEQIREVIPKGSGVVVERSVLRLPDSLYRKTDVHRMTVRTPVDYISKGTTFVVASSDAFGPVMEQPARYAAEYEAYQRVFNQLGHCLPTIQPTAKIPGPQIIVCRFDAPIQ